MTRKTILAVVAALVACIGAYIATRPPSQPFAYTPAASDGRLFELRSGPTGEAMSARAFYQSAVSPECAANPECRAYVDRLMEAAP